MGFIERRRDTVAGAQPPEVEFHETQSTDPYTTWAEVPTTLGGKTATNGTLRRKL